MVVYYRDDIGFNAVITNEYNITFSVGKAYFTDADGKDYTIDVSQLVEIANDEHIEYI